MSSLLDIIWGAFIGFLVILVLLVAQNASDSTLKGMNIESVPKAEITADKIIEADFYKIGYKAEENKILFADSNQIKYRADFDNDGTVDIITYYLGTFEDLASTPNPHDFPLYRKVNNGQPIIANAVSKFFITYLDYSGKKIDYSELEDVEKRKLIKILSIEIFSESPCKIENEYKTFVWEMTLSPQNL